MLSAMFLKVGGLQALANLPLDMSGVAAKFAVRQPKLEGLLIKSLARMS